MKMKKPFWAMILFAVLALALLPTIALASKATSVTVGGVTLDGTVNNTYATTSSSGVVTLGSDESSYHIKFQGGVLTLNGATIAGVAQPYGTSSFESDFAIYAADELTLVLVGANTVYSGTGADIRAGICVNSLGGTNNGSLTIEGDGSLDVYAAAGGNHVHDGIRVAGSLTINSGTITAEGRSTDGNSYGVRAVTDFVMNGGMLTATGGDVTGVHSSRGVIANDTVTINGGTLIATGGTGTSSSYGVSAGTENGIILNVPTGGTMNVTAKTKDTTDDDYRRAFNRAPVISDGAYYTWSLTENNPTPTRSTTTPYRWEVSQTFTELSFMPAVSSAISDVTVSGMTGTAITPVDATLTLTNEQFNSLAADADVSGWFTNLPAGLAAKMKTAVAANATTATVTFSGTPTATSTEAMAVTVPAASLIGNADLAITANANARWAIAPVTLAGLPMTATATESSYYVNGANSGVGTVTATEPPSWNAKLELISGAYQLTLKDLDISAMTGVPSGIMSRVPLTLHLDGTTKSKVILRSHSGVAGGTPAVYVNGDLTLTAANDSAGLYIYNNTGDGIRVTGNMTVEGSVKYANGVTNKAGYCGIYVGGNLLTKAGSDEVTGACNVSTTDTDSRGMKVLGDVVANGESLAAGGGNNGIGLEAGGSITLNNGYIKLHGGAQAVNKAPDLSAHPAYIYSIDDNMQNWQHMPYAYDTTHEYIYIANMPSAAISNVTVSGTSGTTIAPVDATLTLTVDWFNTEIPANTDVSGWFTNIPAGLTATLKTTVAAQSATATVTFSGTPTATLTAPMAVTIPADQLSYSLAITADANANARWELVPALTVTPSGSTSFQVGCATGNAVFTVTSSDGQLNATDHYRSATLDGQPLALGSVGTPGADGSLADGSLVATLNQAKLNTLAVGNHTLVITLGGAFAGRTVAGAIAVTPPAAVPKTGDGTPLLGLALLALLACGGCACLLARRQHVKR